jgi:hypothetical protein
MNQLSESSRGEFVPQRHPTGLDLILQARALRHQWLVAAFARLSAKLAWLVSELVVRARPGLERRRPAPERLRFSGRLVL